MQRPEASPQRSGKRRFLADETSIAPEVAAEQSLRDEALRDVLDQLDGASEAALSLLFRAAGMDGEGAGYGGADSSG